MNLNRGLCLLRECPRIALRALSVHFHAKRQTCPRTLKVVKTPSDLWVASEPNEVIINAALYLLILPKKGFDSGVSPSRSRFRDSFTTVPCYVLVFFFFFKLYLTHFVSFCCYITLPFYCLNIVYINFHIYFGPFSVWFWLFLGGGGIAYGTSPLKPFEAGLYQF